MDDSIKRQMLALLPRLRRFAFNLSGQWESADDLVQETYERAIRGLDGWAAGTRLDAWMYRILRNLFLNERRSLATREERAPEVLLVSPTRVDGQRIADSRITFEKTCLAIGDLPEEQRTALLLVTVEGFSYKEAAALMDQPVGTIASRVGRARETLKHLIEPPPEIDHDAETENQAQEAQK